MSRGGRRLGLRLWVALAALLALAPALPPPAAHAATFSNTSAIEVSSLAVPAGRAAPFPSEIVVAGLSGNVTKVTVTLVDFSHTWSEDVDILLVGPTGANAIILSDVGDGSVTAITLTLDDAAAEPAPSPLRSGTFRPANVGAADAFPAPAPAASGGSALSVFNGTNPNGTWKLYVVDDLDHDAPESGRIAGGWTLDLTVADRPPTISDIPDQVTPEDGAAGPIAFSVGDAETPAGSLILAATSSNPTLVPVAGVAFGGSGGGRTVTISPAPDQFGTATITVTVRDGAGQTASDSFTLTVTPVADPPTIADIPDQAMLEDGGPLVIPFTIGGDAAAPAGSLAVSATSSDQALVPDGFIVLGGAGSSRTLSITPSPDRAGSATISVTVRQGDLAATDTFVLTVTPVNYPPRISVIRDQFITLGATLGPIPVFVTDPDGNEGLILSATSSNPVLVPVGNITFGGAGTDRTVAITPAAGQHGTAEITVTVSDGALTASRTFALRVFLPSVSIANARRLEGKAGRANLVFKVTLSSPGALPVSVRYATEDLRPNEPGNPARARAGQDYVPRRATLTISPGRTVGAILVPIGGDTTVEPNEQFSVVLSRPTNARLELGKTSAVGTILDDDGPPQLLIDDAKQREGSSGKSEMVFRVLLTRPGREPVTASFRTQNRTALAPHDFRDTRGKLVIPVGSTTTTVRVPVVPDRHRELNELFTVELSEATVKLADAMGVGTILNDD